jgi:hypothetical protein
LALETAGRTVLQSRRSQQWTQVSLPILRKLGANYGSTYRHTTCCSFSPGQKTMGFSTSEGGPPRERVCGPPGVITSNYLRRSLCDASSGLGGGPRALWMLEAAEGGTMLQTRRPTAWAAVLPVPPPPRSATPHVQVLVAGWFRRRSDPVARER